MSKRVVLSLNENLEIIKHLKKGETAIKISLDYEVGITTVNGLKKNSEKIGTNDSKIQFTEMEWTVRK